MQVPDALAGGEEARSNAFRLDTILDELGDAAGVAFDSCIDDEELHHGPPDCGMVAV